MHFLIGKAENCGTKDDGTSEPKMDEAGHGSEAKDIREIANWHWDGAKNPILSFCWFSVARRNLEEKRDLTRLHLIVGSDEFIRARVENDARILKNLGYPSDLLVKEGYRHDFALWDEAIRYSLDELLPLKRFADSHETSL